MIFRIAASAALALTAVLACAQSYPVKPIRIVIGFPPGGGIDIVGRLLAPKLSESLGQQVVVDNRAGANGIIAAELVAKTAPDGYTIFFGTTGNLSVNAALYSTLPFNIERDFVPLTQTSTVPFLLYVHPALPIRTIGEFIALAKANPGRMNYYSSGNGSLPHLSGELLNTRAGLKTIHVAYKGSAPGMTDLIGGHVQFGFDAAAIGLPHVKAGKLRALVTTGKTRLSFMQDVPSANETLPGFEVVNWYGMVLPAGTSRDVVTRLHTEIVKAMNIPDVREKLIGLGTEPVGSTPEEFGAFMKSETGKWGLVIKSANIRAD
ncbi:MAG TPA: tripartite tricarboxylate transporter substrate binding protein [Burkholderiales bacterium]|nr:tripartite tricarboxylate transporter substrate binding protein [Burkholderiales bacterium]